MWYLNRGAIGLHVLDAFCAGMPMATTQETRHGPEFAYLEDGQNGISDYRARLAITRGGSLISCPSPAEYEHLRAGARKSAKRYTLQKYGQSFCHGIDRCLA